MSVVGRSVVRMLARAIEECNVVETLDAVESLFDARLVAEAEMFELATHFADLSSGDSLRAGRGTLPGTERAVRIGGESTPMIAEFCVAELGARMRMGSWAARRYLADALDTRHRLPLCWEQVRSRQARIPFVRLVASKTRHLSPASAAWVDAAMAEVLDGCLPWGRFESRVEGKVIAADPEAASAREAARAAEQFAKRTRSSEEGTAGFYVRSTAGVIARIDATVALVAEALRAFGDADNENLRRVKAMALLCNPTKAVELLAAFAAHRSRSTDVALPLAQGNDQGYDPGAPEPPVEPDALDRMNAFARKVEFTPTLSRHGLPSVTRGRTPSGRASPSTGLHSSRR